MFSEIKLLRMANAQFKCLKQRSGYIVYVPYHNFFHYESVDHIARCENVTICLQ